MDKKEPHNIPTLRIIFDYIFRRKGNGSRHELERAMQRDPFVEDAVEGFSMLEEQEAIQRIHHINRQIRQQNQKGTRLWYAGVAATIALLIMAGAGYLFLEQSHQSRSESMLSLEQTEAAEKKEHPPVSPEIPLEETPQVQKDALSGMADEIIITPEETLEDRETTAMVAEINELVADAETSDWEDTEESWTMKVDTSEQMAAAEPALAQEDRIQSLASPSVLRQEVSPMIVLPESGQYAEEPSMRIIRGQVVDATDWITLPGVTVSVPNTTFGTVTDSNGMFELVIPSGEDLKITASFIGMKTLEFAASDFNENEILALEPDMASLDEIVVVGYGTSNRRGHEQGLYQDDRLNRRDYTPPMPRMGYSDYRNFLSENAILPGDDERSRAVVVLRFEISQAGVPQNFEVIRSPGEEYSQKAIELVRNGPGWHHAAMGGQYLNDPVRLRIVFRKE